MRLRALALIALCTAAFMGCASTLERSAPIPLTHTTAFAFPDSVQLLYDVSGEVKKMRYQMHGELLWKHDGHSYEAKLTASMPSMPFLGSRTRTSTGAISTAGLTPQRFSDQWRNENVAFFDNVRHRASFSANTPDVDLDAAAQDQLSVILQIAGILAANPSHYPPTSKLAAQIIGVRDANVWVFRVDGPETIHVPNGEMNVLKLTRDSGNRSEQKIELWLSPTMGYLPVRIKISNANGDFVEQQLRAVESP